MALAKGPRPARTRTPAAPLQEDAAQCRLCLGPLGRSQYLVQEYLEIIQHRLKDVEVMRNYLHSRGIKVPTQISFSG